MMKTRLQKLMLTGIAGLMACGAVNAQSLHFSQYYNNPSLVNPANTALMPDFDYRAGVSYRTQWQSVPVPYNTFSAFTDFKVAAHPETSNNWLGVGVALFNDKAGTGNLSLTSINGSLAYHLQLTHTTMLSLGLNAGYVQRSVNYDNLTFDVQWDGFQFNKNNSNQERGGIAKTSYVTAGAGMNLAYYPSEALYISVGGGVANVNQPKESFYDQNNKVYMRETGNVDVFARVSPNWIVCPSVYYTTQDGAYELVFGSLFRINLGGTSEKTNTQFIFGAYHRWADAIIGATGFQWGGLQLMASYDATISGLAPYNGGQGALEFSLIYQGLYGNREGGMKIYNCPRFF